MSVALEFRKTSGREWQMDEIKIIQEKGMFRIFRHNLEIGIKRTLFQAQEFAKEITPFQRHIDNFFFRYSLLQKGRLLSLIFFLFTLSGMMYSQTDGERIEKLEAQLAKADTLILQLMESMTEQKILDIYMDDRIRDCPHKTYDEYEGAAERYHRFVYESARKIETYIYDNCGWKYKRHFVQDASRKVRESGEPHPIKDIINRIKSKYDN
jgi:uncharacterized coiled-coil protein SlyX